MKDELKLTFYTQGTCECSVDGIAEHFANNLLDCTKTMVVTTRPNLKVGQNSQRLTPSEFTAFTDLGVIKRGQMVGAGLVIDAQPVYDSGRILNTIKTDAAIGLARKAIEQFGKVMQYLIVVCDEKEVAAIKAAVEPEVAAC